MENTEENQPFGEVIYYISALLGFEPPKEKVLISMTEFGTSGFSYIFNTGHLVYLKDLRNNISTDEVFDGFLVKQWMLAIDLIVSQLEFKADNVNVNHVLNEGINLASIISFPVIEDICRKISESWDEEGILTKDTPEGIIFYSIKPDGTKQVRTYKIGQRIVELEHKLQLFEHYSSDQFRGLIASLNESLAIPRVAGIPTVMDPLFYRLQFHRNMWLHGRKFDGYISLFNVLFLAFIYFDPQRRR